MVELRQVVLEAPGEVGPIHCLLRRPAPFGKRQQPRKDLTVHLVRLPVDVRPEIRLQTQDMADLVSGHIRRDRLIGIDAARVNFLVRVVEVAVGGG